MDVAFVLHVNVVDVSTLADEADAILNDLTSAGHDVISCVPWTRPTTAPATAYPLPSMPPPPTNPPTLLSPDAAAS